MQSSNLYVYCINNPVRYKDVSGNDIVEASKGFFAGLMGQSNPSNGPIPSPPPRNNPAPPFQPFVPPNNNSSEDFVAGYWTGQIYADAAGPYVEFMQNHDFVFDVSVSFPLIGPVSGTIGYSYLQGNASDYTAGYVHVGAGPSVGLFPVSGSMSLGIVNNSPTPEITILLMFGSDRKNFKQKKL